MKTLQQIQTNLDSFSNNFGIDIPQDQGGTDWLLMKLGVISASNVYKIMGKKDSETRKTYLMELVAQVCTGDSEELNSKYLDWGKQHEAQARSSYEFINGVKINNVPFIFKDETYREGCSPDGLLENKGIEIKCPYNPVHYVKFLIEDKIKSEYIWQAQYQMRITGAAEWDFVQYHPLMQKKPFKCLTIQRNEEMQSELNERIPEFISEMDSILEKIGIKFGEQWSRIGNLTTTKQVRQ